MAKIGLGQAAETLVHYIRLALPDGFISLDSEQELQDAIDAFRDAEPPAPKPKPEPERRADWHYDSQGYCDNPARGY